MAFGFAGAAAGASDALQQMLAERRAAFLQQEQLRLQQEAAERQAAQFDASLGMQNKRLAFDQAQAAADEADRKGQRERQATQDRSVENQRGVRRMIGDFLVQRGTQPLDAGSRQTLQGMAIQEDVDLPDAVTTDPEQKFRDAERMAQIQAKYRPTPQGPAPTERVLVSPDGKAQRVVRGSGEVNALLGQGWKLHDPVAARQNNAPDPNEAMHITQSALNLAKRLYDPRTKTTEKGLDIDAATGAYELRGFTQGAVDFNSVRDQLVAALALPNLGALKGPMSDKDILFVKQLATRLENRSLSRPETERAITEAIQFLEGKMVGSGGEGVTVGGQLTWDPVAKRWVQ